MSATARTDGAVTCLWALGTKLWMLSGAYCVFRNTRGYAAVGADSGTGIALGVLYATPTLDPGGRIAQALSAAGDHTDVCRSPFHFETLSGATSGSRLTFVVGAVRPVRVGEHTGDGMAGPSLPATELRMSV